MSIDILTCLSNGEMSLEEAEAEYERVMDSSEKLDPRMALCLSREEWTAFAQGVWFDELAEWRKSGWPSTCVRCGRRLDVDAFGWLAQEVEGNHELVHVECHT